MAEKLKILISGFNGKMGKVLFSCLETSDIAMPYAGVDKFIGNNNPIPVFANFNDIVLDKNPDCIIDFSVKDAIYSLLPYAVEHKIPVVLATTGYNAKDLNFIAKAAKQIPIMRSGNMSIGINALVQLVKQAADLLPNADIEIIEAHHNLKVDSPSGTALMLKNAADSKNQKTMTCGRNGIVGKRQNSEIGMHSVRGGTIVGTHEVMFILNNEFITLKHNAESKSIFALGSITAAAFLIGKPAKEYGMQDIKLI